MDQEKIDAAAERVLCSRAGKMIPALRRDIELLADAYLELRDRELRKKLENANAVTREWLLSLGFEEIVWSCSWFAIGRNGRGYEIYCQFHDTIDAPIRWEIGTEELALPFFKSRGQVFALLAALGIEVRNSVTF